MTNPRDRILDRLASGKDTPVVGRLRTPDGCLCFQGVIADEYIRETGHARWGRLDTSLGPVTALEMPDGTTSTGWLPGEIEDWSGFTDDEISTGTSMNDSGDPFPVIARALRED